MGSTANGLANMQAIAEKYGTSPKAWLIVSLVGAFLIDLINAILITWMGTW
jgi:ESS family glutamate:Na+ symporter